MGDVFTTEGVALTPQQQRGHGQRAQIIMRNILYGCRTFKEIAAGAPGLSRALLARRLRELARAGIIEIVTKP